MYLTNIFCYLYYRHNFPGMSPEGDIDGNRVNASIEFKDGESDAHKGKFSRDIQGEGKRRI